MRCLYCGKELALLKRWTGGGEFCSDAHRQRYQEEYNQLALNRLLQAQPTEAKPDLKSDSKLGDAKTKNKPETRIEEQPEIRVEPRRELGTEPEYSAPVYAKREERHEQPSIAVAEPPSVATAARVAAETVSEPSRQEAEAPAPLGGFLQESWEPALVEPTQTANPELEWMPVVDIALPAREAGSPTALSTVQLVAGEPLSLALAGRFRDCDSYPRDRRVEIREFVRPLPIVEVNRGAEDTSLEMATQPLQILPPSPCAPAEAALWQESAREFSVPEPELGELTRLAFDTTGFEDQPQSIEAGGVAAAESQPEAPVAEIAAKPQTVAATPPQPEPEPVSEAAREAVPELARRPVPLTLHGLAAGRGKPVQIFTAALGGVTVQLPRSSALPLRPVIVLGPRLAPAQAQVTPGLKVAAVEEKSTAPLKGEIKPEAKPEARPESKLEPTPDPKSDLKKAAPPAKPDPRTSGKNRRPGVRVIPPDEIPVEKTAPPTGASAKEPASDAQKRETTRIEAAKVFETAPAPPAKAAPAKPETLKPAAASVTPSPKFTPHAAPQTTADLDLPTLGLSTSSSGWSRLSGGAKVGVAAVVALLVAGVVLFLVKGGGGSARAETTPRVMEAGPALPTGESGWITNWGGGEAGVRKTHDISVLRPSLNLTDYRVDLQGQIESKGMGWVVRAMNSKNYYVLRLEIVKPGLEPTVQFVRFAMVEGQEQSRMSLTLPFPVRIDTLYKIRTDVVGSHITTWIQEHKLDDWTDEHVKTGGAGLYYERGERASLKGGLNVVPLTLKN